MLAYVAVSMGIFVTQKAKTTIDKGQQTASTALSPSGNILYATNFPSSTKSYWIYFPMAPTSGVSSVELSPSTTAISFTASAESVALANIYNYTLLTSTTQSVSVGGTSYLVLQEQTSGGQNFYYYTSPYAALLALSKVTPNGVFSVSSGACGTASSSYNQFEFNYSSSEFCAKVYQTFAFTFPVSGDALVGSAVLPAGASAGVMILFGPTEGNIVFQYQTVTIQVQPNIGSPLTLSQYIYQPDGYVSVIG